VLEINDRSVTAIRFTPSVSVPPSDNLSDEELQEGLYLLKSGLERRFIYKYDISQYVSGNLNSIQLDTVSWVSVKTPQLSRGREIANGKTTDPDAIVVGKMNYFNLKGHNRGKSIKLAYTLPPNKKQELLVEIILKILGGTLPSWLDLIFIKPNKLLTPEKKKRWSITLFCFQLFLIAVLAWLSFFSPSVSTEKISDVFILITQAILSFFILRVKNAEERKSEQ
jgi:hypothetical protein